MMFMNMSSNFKCNYTDTLPHKLKNPMKVLGNTQGMRSSGSKLPSTEAQLRGVYSNYPTPQVSPRVKMKKLFKEKMNGKQNNLPQAWKIPPQEWEKLLRRWKNLPLNRRTHYKIQNPGPLLIGNYAVEHKLQIHYNSCAGS
jgi:hypothetical protein